MKKERDPLLNLSFRAQMERVRGEVGRTVFEFEMHRHRCPQCGARSWKCHESPWSKGYTYKKEYSIECQRCWSASKLSCRVEWGIEAVVKVLFLNMIPGGLRVAERLRGEVPIDA